jgi:hypothetical protein
MTISTGMKQYPLLTFDSQLHPFNFAIRMICAGVNLFPLNINCHRQSIYDIQEIDPVEHYENNLWAPVIEEDTWKISLQNVFDMMEGQKTSSADTVDIVISILISLNVVRRVATARDPFDPNNILSGKTFYRFVPLRTARTRAFFHDNKQTRKLLFEPSLYETARKDILTGQGSFRVSKDIFYFYNIRKNQEIPVETHFVADSDYHNQLLIYSSDTFRSRIAQFFPNVFKVMHHSTALWTSMYTRSKEDRLKFVLEDCSSVVSEEDIMGMFHRNKKQRTA